MHIVATYENLLPRSQADAEVFVNTAAALARQPDLQVELLVPRNPASSVTQIREYFGVQGPLQITELPSWRGVLATQHLVHAIASSRRGWGADLVYTRNLATLTAALQRGHLSALDHYRPWADQVPPLQPLLRALMGHPRFLGGVIHSELARRSYVRLGVPEARLTVAHNGWDPARMEPALDQREARHRVGLAEDAFTVVYTGRINRQKGLDTVLELARRCPDMRFVLVGSEGEGPIEREARELANVHIEPWKRFDETAPYLYAADVMMVPPSSTPLLQHGNTVLPLKLFLYLAAGRPILGPDSPDCAEVLDQGGNALLVPPGDLDAAAAALRRLRDDATLRDGMGRAARTKARSCTWDARAAHIRHFLEQRLAATSGSDDRRVPLGDWNVARWLGESGRWLAWAASHGSLTAPAQNVLKGSS